MSLDEAQFKQIEGFGEVEREGGVTLNKKFEKSQLIIYVIICLVGVYALDFILKYFFNFDLSNIVKNIVERML
ncbi:TPA: hypothetical protein ACGOYX_000707 [Streptococcus suis]